MLKTWSTKVPSVKIIFRINFNHFNRLTSENCDHPRKFSKLSFIIGVSSYSDIHSIDISEATFFLNYFNRSLSCLSVNFVIYTTLVQEILTNINSSINYIFSILIECSIFFTLIIWNTFSWDSFKSFTRLYLIKKSTDLNAWKINFWITFLSSPNCAKLIVEMLNISTKHFKNILH